MFALGNLVSTPGALSVLNDAGVSPMLLIQRHRALERGDLERADHERNKQAVLNGARIFSSFLVGETKVWVITEAVDDAGKRQSTCIMLPSEY